MLSPKEGKEDVASYFFRTVKKPEGLLLVLLMVAYLFAFIFFDHLLPLVTKLGGQINNDDRLSYLIIPWALMASYIWMDTAVHETSNRILNALATLALAAIPIVRMFKLL